MDDLTVWSVFWGDKYDKGYVYALKEQVENNLSIEHDFKCITTAKLPGIQTVLPYVPYHGWWSKLNLFCPRIATGPSLYFDLDVLITGNLDYLADFTDTFSAPSNWAQSGHGGIQSSVMAWPGNWTEPYEKIKDQWPQVSERLWGDQEFLWEILGDNWQKIPGVGSYKYHVKPKGAIPEDMCVCVFHGKPDPHEVNDPCLSSFTAIVHNHIKSNTANGSQKASSATG